MLYLVGGAPRTGKTKLTNHLATELGAHVESTDELIGWLSECIPELDITFAADPDRPGRAGPVLRRMTKTLTSQYDDVLIEGELLHPQHVSAFRDDGHDVA